MPYIPIESYEHIDIYKHAFIEASAGTGKTYTIENLVVKMLLDRKDLCLENILLVTFTEKATCELKVRIREKLETLLNKMSDQSDTDKIKTALDSFDHASIHTIHGFCQSVLRDYAFEHKAPFKWEVIDDRSLHERLLKEQIRKTWPEKFGQTLSDLLIISGFTRQKAGFELSIINAARSFHQSSDQQIKPDISNLTYSMISEKINIIREMVVGLKALSVPGPFCHGFDRLNVQKPQKRFLSEQIITPLTDILTNFDPNNSSLQPLLDIITSIDKKGPDYLQVKYLKKGGPNPEVCPHWELVYRCLEKIHEIYLSVKDALQAIAILQLQEDVAAEKLKNGWISFNDMLSHVQKALCSSEGSPLVNILRKKYRIAFVDEFQDTDPVQWQIFKKIFIQNNEHILQNLLFLIGDPKQAIYAFRGADVYAYLDARKEMETLRQKGYANCYCLTTNWRSGPELINVLNQLFSNPEWFSPPDKQRDFEITYIPTRAPDEDKRVLRITRDHSDRGFLNIFDLRDAPSPKASKTLLAKHIAEEINHLVCTGHGIHYWHHGEKTSLSFGDICILVRGKSDMPFLEDQLDGRNIPYSYYKKPGLFASREAYYLSLVFHAINEPANIINFHKALLTPFFAFKPEDLHFAQEMAPSHPVKRLVLQWHHWSFLKKWSVLFQSLLEDSGLIFRESIKSDWERTFTNYRQILEHLQETAYHQNLDFRAMTALLDGYVKGTSNPGQEADLHQIETEDLKVQIMTMHVAKGLEYPVVFVFGGLTRPSAFGSDFYIYHKICGQPPKPIKIFDLSKTQDGKKQYDSEILAEDKRLFYVALTRARIKLYLPYYEYTRNYSWVGPVCNLLSPALKNVFGQSGQKNNMVHWLKESSADICKGAHYGFQEKTAIMSDKPDNRNPEFPIPDPMFLQTGDFSHRIIKMASFSSLHQMALKKKGSENTSPGFSTLYDKSKENDETFVSGFPEFEEEPSSTDHIPGGTQTGSMFHDILENISFESVLEASLVTKGTTHPLLARSQNKELIESRMDNYQIDRRWINSICDIILNTLTTPVSQLDQSFILAKLTKDDRLHEAEFYFPYPFKNQKNLPELFFNQGYIRGFIDLIFKYQHKFFIADWKSNILEEGYSQSSMEKCMTLANYHLQYKIYTIATLRWLKCKMGKSFDPDINFGGIFYFYLRGMDGKSGRGIYHVPGNKISPLEKLENDLLMI